MDGGRGGERGKEVDIYIDRGGEKKEVEIYTYREGAERCRRERYTYIHIEADTHSGRKVEKDRDTHIHIYRGGRERERD